MKQPRALYLYSLVDIWERFGFYTLRSILTLYFLHVLLLTQSDTYSLFAAFSAYLYLTPVLGGIIADNILTCESCVYAGAVLLSIGYAVMPTPLPNAHIYSLSIIAIGSGLFMPNIANMVNRLYQKNDAGKEAGFSIFYTAINIGAFAPPLIAPFLIRYLGWSWAFEAAALGVVIALLSFYAIQRSFVSQNKHLTTLWKNSLYFIGILFAEFIVLYLFLTHAHLANIALLIMGATYLFYSLYRSKKFQLNIKKKLLACHLLIIFSIVFGILYQQSAMSLTVFTDRYVRHHLFGIDLTTPAFLALNPLFIVVLGPILAKLWAELAKKNLNPSFTLKFSMGTIFMGLGFALLTFANLGGNQHFISPVWLIVSYFLQTLGEMLVSPIGLSMVTDLSPTKMHGTMLGTWYFATAVSDCLAGYVSKLTIYKDAAVTPLAYYLQVFGEAGAVAILVGVVILFAVKPINSIIQMSE
ncbi:MAG: hypothetical protein A3F67_03565 [Verrucomicrobia bacterium RIFCSPHIGHO2_12_FULL_41_10]|nr:MAG: hypothetical protein A3F67_03565 [Verrucomicrobia bacterium RIFCSPHIGHO2_12_FULL_41_10]